MKTEPKGVRWDKDLMEHLEKEGIATTFQGALNFLTAFYWQKSKLKKEVKEKKQSN